LQFHRPFTTLTWHVWTWGGFESIPESVLWQAICNLNPVYPYQQPQPQAPAQVRKCQYPPKTIKHFFVHQSLVSSPAGTALRPRCCERITGDDTPRSTRHLHQSSHYATPWELNLAPTAPNKRFFAYSGHFPERTLPIPRGLGTSDQDANKTLVGAPGRHVEWRPLRAKRKMQGSV